MSEKGYDMLQIILGAAVGAVIAGRGRESAPVLGLGSAALPDATGRTYAQIPPGATTRIANLAVGDVVYAGLTGVVTLESMASEPPAAEMAVVPEGQPWYEGLRKPVGIIADEFGHITFRTISAPLATVPAGLLGSSWRTGPAPLPRSYVLQTSPFALVEIYYDVLYGNWLMVSPPDALLASAYDLFDADGRGLDSPFVQSVGNLPDVVAQTAALAEVPAALVLPRVAEPSMTQRIKIERTRGEITEELLLPYTVIVVEDYLATLNQSTTALTCASGLEIPGFISRAVAIRAFESIDKSAPYDPLQFSYARLVGPAHRWVLVPSPDEDVAIGDVLTVTVRTAPFSLPHPYVKLLTLLS